MCEGKQCAGVFFELPEEYEAYPVKERLERLIYLHDQPKIKKNTFFYKNEFLNIQFYERDN